ncbi:MAG: fructose-1,6-bisphosphatase, partial [Candidatus Peregrinibacteria bacterium]|nr:fructose-1,6-bisphosphatase [Candidatus Peregrinibacteria bacterium]
MAILLDTHLYEAGADDKLRHLIMYIARAGKYINHALQTGDLGLAGSSNLFGEHQLALDVLADEIIEENLMICRLVKAAISEEKEDVVHCKCKGEDCGGKYAVAYDPLDGSSLVETNLAVGSIFSIMEGDEFMGRTGREQVAALYMVYGPRTTLVYTVGKGVHEFTLNDVGEFHLTNENIKLGETTKHFAPGNLRAGNINKKYQELINSYMENEYTLRYSGGMVPDINHMLLKREGIFTYPANPPRYPEGKLRLLFECNPFSFLIEQAGGASSNGHIPVMDMEIESLHQRT